MKQQSFTDIEYSNRKRTTKRDKFLKQMDEIIPWDHWVELIRPYYPSGKRGRPPKGIETMLRMYLLQIWFSLSDEGLEDSIYDSYQRRIAPSLSYQNYRMIMTTIRLFGSCFAGVRAYSSG